MTKMGGEQVEVWIEKMILLEMVSEISSQIDENSFDLTFIEKKYVIIFLTSRIKTKFGWGDILNAWSWGINCVKYLILRNEIWAALLFVLYFRMISFHFSLFGTQKYQ